MARVQIQVFSVDDSQWVDWDGVVSATVDSIGTIDAVTAITDPVTTNLRALATTGPDTFTQLRAASAANMAGGSASFPGGALVTSRPGDWIEFNDPGAALQASAVRLAAAGLSHYITSISACVLAVNAQAGLTLQLLDGASIISSWKFPIPPTGQGREFVLSGLNIGLSTNSAATLRFSAAPAAGNFQSVAMTGYTVA